MSVGYSAVQWSRHKRVYDLVAVASIVAFIGVFIAVSKAAWPGDRAYSDEVVIIRALGACAMVLLHVVLAIGPCARLFPRFLPLLYNRRHLGVMTFLIALAHGVLSIGYYHGFGSINPLVSLLTSNTNYTSLSAFPFQTLGAAALIILFLLAATSHDFWNKLLSPVGWKRVHMLVYPAYVLLIAHVALGSLQTDRGPLAATLVCSGALVIAALHLIAGWRERTTDQGAGIASDGLGRWIDVGAPADIPADRARTVCSPGGERIAVFKHDGRISAVTNVCAHQGGPLGEGRVVDGCITCPWHGWQYRPSDGCSPPPFQEKLATYQVRIADGRVQVNDRALPPGTPTDEVRVPESSDA